MKRRPAVELEVKAPGGESWWASVFSELPAAFLGGADVATCCLGLDALLALLNLEGS